MNLLDGAGKRGEDEWGLASAGPWCDDKSGEAENGALMARRKTKESEKIMGNILPGLVRDRGWETQLDLHSIFPVWHRVVQGDAGKYAVPLKIVKGTLWLEVENSAWLQQFQFQKISLLDSVNAFLKKSSIRDIRFVLPSGKEKESTSVEKVRFKAPARDELKKFEEQVAFIEDKEIRESLVQLWYLSKACVRQKK
ncbi:DciA family protein [Desulfopila sp. IMCC35008]|uniref:DciA family protein n=1 Tax=Desulfopila sp. IMCC35008 TaxID=2653858 RepID=UPI0013D5C37B|nr:DUF721 domain-containing protein [Desulfopila sp. IMCC35008]